MTIPIDERFITDEQVFEAFDLTAPGLEQTAKSYRDGELEKAKEHLCSYFQKRSNVHFLFDYRAKPLQPINPQDNPYAFQASLGFGNNLKEFCLDAAKKMMKNIYVLPGEGRGEVDLGTNFENMIHFNFLTDNGTSHRNHLDMFVRGQFFEYLSILYHETGDEEICQHFRVILDKFLETYPLLVSDTSAGANRFQYDEDRDAMSVGFLCLSYITLLYTRLSYDSGYATVFELIKHIWFLGIQFRRFDTDIYKPYNHHMWERGIIPFVLGTLLPEIPDFVQMRERGSQIVCQHVKDDFNAYGGYNELSIAYWAGAALGEMLYRGASLARLNNIPFLDEDALQRIDKSFTALASICPPYDRFPSLGDNRGSLVNPILQIGINMTNNAACKALLAARNSNSTSKVKSDKNCAQPEKSVPKPDILPLDYNNHHTGFVCLRSNFDTDGSYLLMSAKTDCGASGHNHMDMLSIFLTIKGVPIIGEPYADYLYRNVKMNTPARGYQYNMSAHNTVLAFGEPVAPDRVFAERWGVYRPDSPVTEFVSNEAGAYVSAYHTGYPHCRHTRKLLFSRNGALLVRDEIARGNRVPEPHLQRWHLEQGCKASVYNEDCVIVEKDGLKLLFIWEKADLIEINDDRKIFCPDLFPNGTPLAPIIDVSFSNMHDITTDLLMVPLNMLILDITGKEMPDTGLLYEQLLTLALQMDAPDALQKLSTL